MTTMGRHGPCLLLNTTASGRRLLALALLLLLLPTTIRGGGRLDCDVWGLEACLQAVTARYGAGMVGFARQDARRSPCDIWTSQLRCLEASCATDVPHYNCGTRQVSCQGREGCNRRVPWVGAASAESRSGERESAAAKGLYHRLCPPGLQHCGVEGGSAQLLGLVAMQPVCQPDCGARALLPAVPKVIVLDEPCQSNAAPATAVQDVMGNDVLRVQVPCSSSAQPAAPAGGGPGGGRPPRLLVVRSVHDQQAVSGGYGDVARLIRGQRLISGLWGLFEMGGEGVVGGGTADVTLATNIGGGMCDAEALGVQLLRVGEGGGRVSVDGGRVECSEGLLGPQQCGCLVVGLQLGGVFALAVSDPKAEAASDVAATRRRLAAASSSSSSSQPPAAEEKGGGSEAGKANRSRSVSRGMEAELALIEQKTASDKAQSSSPEQQQVKSVPLRNKVVVVLAVCAFVANGGFLIYVFWLI